MRRCVVLVFGICLLLGSTVAPAQEQTNAAVFEYNDKGSRDPFWPLVTKTGSINNYEEDFLINELILEGVMSGEGGSNLAIINGKVVKKNGIIGQYVVVEIYKENVILIKDNQKFELKLKRGE